MKADRLCLPILLALVPYLGVVASVARDRHHPSLRHSRPPRGRASRPKRRAWSSPTAVSATPLGRALRAERPQAEAVVALRAHLYHRRNLHPATRRHRSSRWLSLHGVQRRSLPLPSRVTNATPRRGRVRVRRQLLERRADATTRAGPLPRWDGGRDVVAMSAAQPGSRDEQ